MTTVIDERVVEMRFNNEDFEKNVAQSMSTLDKLKNSLNFDSGKSLEDLGKATKGFELSGISQKVTEVTSKFSALETMGVGALLNIGAKAADLGVKLVKSLTIDQITSGFDKYAEKTSAVQTIMAATAKDFSNQAEQMEYVNEQLDKLMWFTDETSYNFLDMAGNIGKFTNNGIKLDQAVTAMQGIAQWAGISGANTQEASRAMYNFSQAMGAGAMKLQDWKSIENANMATMEFKTIAAETAVEMGKLQKVSDGVYQTMEGHTFTLAQFSSYLKDQWFTADVMVGSLSKYGEFTNQLYEVAEATDLTATELLKYIDKYKEGNLDLQAVSKETGVSVQDLDGYLQKLADDTNDLGIRSFKASQEAKTFKEAIDSVKDAVSSQWMKTSEYIFGDYLQAKALWTGLANTMWEVFAAEGERRNDTLSKWKERNSLIEAFANVLNLVYRPLMAVRDAWHSMFPATASGRAKILDEITIKFKNFTEAIQPTQKTLTGIKNTFIGIFSVFKIIGQAIASVIKAIFPVAKPFGSLLEMLLTFTGTIGIVIQAIAEYAEMMGWFTTITETIRSVFTSITGAIKPLLSIFASGLFKGISVFVAFVIKAISTAGTYISSFLKNTNILQVAVQKITAAFNFLKNAILGLFSPVEKTTTVVKKSATYFAEAADSTVQFGTLTRDAADDVQTIVKPVSTMAKVMQIFGKIVQGLGGVVALAFGGMIKAITSFTGSYKKEVTTSAKDTNLFITIIKALFEGLRGLFANGGKGISEFFNKLKNDAGDSETAFGRFVNNFKQFFKDIDTGRIAAIALSVGLLAIVAASVKLASKVSKATDTVGTFNSITKAVNQFSKKSLVLETIMTFAKAFGIVAVSLTLLSLVPTDKLLVVSGIMLGFITIFSILTGVVIGLSKKLQNAKFQTNFRAMAKSIILLASSMAILAMSVSILASVKLEGGIGELYAKIGAAILMLAGVVGAAIALSRLSKDLPKGAILLLAIAVAMRQLALAVKDFASLPVDNINDHWGTYIAIFSGLSLILAASGHVKVTSALALLALASAMKVILPAMGQIVTIAKELPYEKICKAASDNIGAISFFLVGTLSVLLATIALIEAHKDKVKKAKAKGGNSLFGGIGGAFAGIGVGIALIVESIKKIHQLYSEFSKGEIWEIAGLFAGLMGVLTLCATLIMVANRYFGGGKDDAKIFSRLAILFIGMSISLRIMASAIKAMTVIEDMGKAWQAVAMISILGLVMAAAVGVAGTVQKALPAMTALITATVAMGVLIGELAILSLIVDNPGMDKALLVMAGIFVALNVTMRSMEKIKDVKAGPIIGLVVMVAAVAGSLIYLSTLDFVAVLSAAGAMSAVMLSLAVLFKVIDKMQAVSVKKILSLVGVVTAASLMAVPLYFLAKQDWKGILSAAGGMAVALLAVTAALAILSKVGDVSSMLAASAAIAIISGSMVVMAVAVKILEGVNWSAFAMFAAAVVIIGGILTVMGAVAAKMPLFDLALLAISATFIAVGASFIAISLAFYIFAASLPVLAQGIDILVPSLVNFALNVPFNDLMVGLLQLSVGLAAIAAVGLILGLGAIGLISLAGALAILGLAAPVAATGFERLQTVDLVGVAKGLALIAAAGLVIGLISPALLAAAVGITAFGAALMILNLTLQVTMVTFQAFSMMLSKTTTAIQQKITAIKEAFKKLIPDIASSLKNTGAINGPVKNLVAAIAGEKGSGKGILGGISQKLGWASPPKFILDLMNDIGTALGQNGAATSAASTSGSKIGNAFGSNLANKVGGWLSSVGSGVSSFFNSLSTGSAVISSMGSDLDSTGAQAEKFGKTTNKSFKQAGGLLDFIGEKVNSAKDYVTDLVDVSDLLPEELTNTQNAATGAGGALDEFGESAEGAGKKGKGAAGDVKSLADSLRSSLDLFSKFEVKNEMSSEQLLENMKSNIDGYASWSHRMTVLAERFANNDIPVTLLEKLKDDGPKQQEVMNAIYNMTDEQLAQLRELYATGMALPESQAEIVGSAFTYMGEMATQGFSNALNDHKAAHAAANGLGQAAIDGVAEAIDAHSPSRKTFALGVYMVDGLGLGMTSPSALAMLELCVSQVTSKVLELFDENLSPETMSLVGENILQNLFSNALGTMVTSDNPIISAFTKGLMEVEPVLEALTFFVETVLTQVNTAFGMADSESNSEVFYGYGRGAVQGFANGISMNLGYIHTQIVSMGIRITAWLNDEKFADKFYQAGKNAVYGFANGLSDSKAAEKVMENAQKIADSARKKMQEALDEHSPSKVTEQIGRYASLGLAIGITKGAKNVADAAGAVAEGAADGMLDANGRIQDLLNSELDLNPVITPMLDLSIMRAQLASISDMFNNPAYGLSGQNGGQFTANGTQPASINFTQNNYSPKELSRYDIYRNTKNQISMMKGVIAHA